VKKHTGYRHEAPLLAAVAPHLPDIQACVSRADVPRDGKMASSFDVDTLGGSVLGYTEMTPESFRATTTAQCIVDVVKKAVSFGPADAVHTHSRGNVVITFTVD
jgi:hypothetical protein